MTTQEIMEAFRLMKSVLKVQIRKTAPGPTGYFEQYLAEESPELADLARRLCEAFLEGTAEQRDEIAFDSDDDDILWWFSEFIGAQAALIRGSEDSAPLRLGLAAIAIIGTRSDPRDVTGWLSALSQAARKVCVSNWRQEFENIGDYAADIATTFGQSGNYLKKLIQSYPGVEDESDQRRRRRRIEREKRPPSTA
jgi:hypothetical protein